MLATMKLDGGECNSNYSEKEMKANGWITEDINMINNDNAINVIYVFKKITSTQIKDTNKKSQSSSGLPTINKANGSFEDKVLEILAKKKTQEKQEEEKRKQVKAFDSGKNTYLNMCQRCHGKKAEVEVYGSSRKLSTLSLEQMQDAITGYRFDDYDRGKAVVMKQYADMLGSDDVENIYNFIQTIK